MILIPLIACLATTFWPRPAEAEVDGMRFGRSLVALTDLNGDGVRDFAVGAPTAAPAKDGGTQHEPHSGAVLVLSGADRSVLQVWRGGAGRATFGHTLRSVPDMTGDEIPDVLVGYEMHLRTEVRSGADGTLHFAIDHESQRVQPAGDANHDGLGDLLIGTAPRWEVLSGADGSFGWGRMYIPAPLRLSSVGDLNGDGVHEFCSSARRGQWMASDAPEEDWDRDRWLYSFDNMTELGAALELPWVSRAKPGSILGFALAAPARAVLRAEHDGEVSLIVTDTLKCKEAPLVISRKVGGLQRELDFGYVVADPGDLDGDGTGDLITAEGIQTIACSGADGSVLWTWDGPFDLAFNGVSVAPLADVDGDGAIDVLVGTAEEYWHGPVWRNGAVQLLSGRTGKILWRITEGQFDAKFPRRK
ncbi:MAG: hypothetical protein ACJAZN_002484 [Planctomycetota bacterium]|jgi:hypothetical protein